jgi:DNA-binding NarL/FixJ family response regulator
VRELETLSHHESSSRALSPLRANPRTSVRAGMVRSTRLVLETFDPLSRAGIVSYLSRVPGLILLALDHLVEADIVVVVAPVLNGALMSRLQRLGGADGPRLVLVLDRIDGAHVLSAIDAGVAAIIWRSEAAPERFVEVIQTVAAGGHRFPPEVQSRMVAEVGELRRDVLAPSGLTTSGLSDRETEVLRLIAEGLDITEIAQKVLYSERTVKATIHGVLTRFHLRNRSQAVAYAMRAGLF